MANTKSAKKQIKVIKRNTLRNKGYRSRLKNMIKEARTAIEKKAENSVEITREIIKLIDKTKSKGIIHAKNAANKKSKMMS